LAFPAPSSTFCRCRPGPRGVPCRRPLPTEAGDDDPHDLDVLFEALPRALVPPLGRSSSREIRRPIRRHDQCASTPGSKLPSARLCYLSSSFRPRGFSPPRRLSPRKGPRACCIPQPARVRRVFDWVRSRSRPKTVADLRNLSPRRGFTPFEECPHRQPAPHHCGPLPSCRYWHSSCHARAEAEARWVPAQAGPRSDRTLGAAGPPTRPKPKGDPLARAIVSSTVKLRSAANGGPPRHRGTGASANRHPTCADRHATAPKRRHDERSSPGRSSMPARRSEVGVARDARERPSRAGQTAETADHSLTRPIHRGEPSGPFKTTRAADFRALLRR